MKNPPSQNVPVHFVGSVSPLLVVLLALAALVSFDRNRRD